MVKIYSKYDDFFEGKKRGEAPNPSTPYYVDCVGFISMEQQIRGLINAGQNLENYRRSQYDYQIDSEAVDIDDVEVSPENVPGFMPSVDMPRVVDTMLSNLASAKNSEPVDASKPQGGETTPPNPSDAS